MVDGWNYGDLGNCCGICCGGEEEEKEEIGL